jgi:hypothetical protein
MQLWQFGAFQHPISLEEEERERSKRREGCLWKEVENSGLPRTQTLGSGSSHPALATCGEATQLLGTPWGACVGAR